MAKKTLVANAIVSSEDRPITSLVDCGYQQGATRDALQNQARYVMGKVVGFPESIDDESKAQLEKGYMMRYNDNHPAIEYAIIDGAYIPVGSLNPDSADKIKEKIVIGVDLVFSYTQQEYGKLKTNDKAKYDAFKPWRDGFTDYKSGCLNDLKAMARKLIKKASGATRTANHDFMEWLVRKDEKGATIGMLEDMRTRCRAASKRGDATANIDRLDKALIAFKATYFE